MPIEPEPSRWSLRFDEQHPSDLVAVGADLEPGTLLAAYRGGLFPMGTGRAGAPPIGWWSPLRRGVLRPGDHHASRSLRRARGRFTTSIDLDFAGVVRACADPGREGRWITPAVSDAYQRLHELGWAHSVEVWDGEGQLAGGLYGVAIGGFFAGESMFHRVTDAGKLAVWVVAECFLSQDPRALVDVQWRTPHLATLGVQEIARDQYLTLLEDALAADGPIAFTATENMT